MSGEKEQWLVDLDRWRGNGVLAVVRQLHADKTPVFCTRSSGERQQCVVGGTDFGGRAVVCEFVEGEKRLAKLIDTKVFIAENREHFPMEPE